ncbi:chemotaxis protein CheB [Tateyamaria sp. SN6-1]|uniref:chemotaxis protein CheB n=1 Tax=Tateyamaria sp. SN6-1 TaxID=3092148 RepID=UPI0039F4CE38
MTNDMPSPPPAEPEDDLESVPTTPPAPPIVGVAASAGGLEAVSLLVQNLPADAPAVYVIAQHMSPTHKSVLSTLISRETKLPVHELGVETVPEPNSIYVTPPNTDVVYENGMLRLRNPSGHPATPTPSADRLFKSIAEQCGENCVGIVLSGTGSDGSYGVQAIREVGGITIAQEPSTAKYDGMPTSAIETGCIDLTLSPEQIGTHLEKILARPRNFDGLREFMDTPSPLNDLFAILLSRTQVDFRDYKENTLSRRVSRRMTALGVDSYDAYVDYCRTNTDEVDALHRDLLISVTRFFRDPLQFDHLKSELSETLNNRPNGPIRLWIVGCATGEEAYTIAIIVAELLGGISALSKRNVQIFATDIDQNAIEVARRGIYPITAAQDIPPELLADYFLVSGTNITVRPDLRAVTLFSHHNIFQDPPFINVDLVSIRNLLIYFNLSLQERVLSRLHYALNSTGLLFLGTSETVGEMSVFFEARQGAEKVFGKRRGISGELSIEPGAGMFHRNRRRGGMVKNLAAPNDPNVQADLSLARVVAPNGFITTRNGTIIEVLGDLSPFLEIRAGASTSLNIKMLIEPLLSEVTSLIAVSIRNEARRVGRWHSVSLPVGNRIQMSVFPFHNYKGGEMHCLVAIDTKFEEQLETDLEDITDKEQRAYVERMEMEVRSTQEALQQTIEELQTANEELQSANEELQSTNEEFQATNEELETSNEELQSTNEELLTVNEELQISSAERQALASELEATLASAPYAIALADQALTLRRMSRVSLELFGLRELPPTGVHLSQCSLPAGFPALAPLANTVLRLQEVRRVPILSEGKHYTMLLSPVHDQHQKLIGLSITVTQYDNEPLAQLVSMISKLSHVAHWTYNLDTKELVWSPEMYALHGVDISGKQPTWDEAHTKLHPEDRDTHLDRMQRLIDGGGTMEYEVRAFGPDGKIIRIKGIITIVRDSLNEPIQMIGVVWDMASKAHSPHYRESLEALQDDMGIGVYSVDVENYDPSWNAAMYDLLGHKTTEVVPSIELLLQHIVEADRARMQDLLQRTLEHGESFVTKTEIQRIDGDVVAVECRGQARRGAQGRVTHVFGSLRAFDDARLRDG